MDNKNFGKIHSQSTQGIVDHSDSDQPLEETKDDLDND